MQVARNDGFTEGATTRNVTATYTDFTGLAAGTRYYWWTRAVNGSVTSAWSTVWSFTTAGGGTSGRSNLFFLHHSSGQGFIDRGVMRALITFFNSQRGTRFVFWDHGQNSQGLTNASGQRTGTNYAIPDDNTDPIGLYRLWTGTEARYVTCRNQILSNHQVIAFKSCFPASNIPNAATLQQYKTWYLAIRAFCDSRPDNLFIVMSTPPLHRLATNATAAANARAFEVWLSSSEYLAGHPNVRCFNVFDILAQANNGSAGANMLKYDYERSHTSSDSHPNTAGNQAVGPAFADFLCNSALAYR